MHLKTKLIIPFFIQEDNTVFLIRVVSTSRKMAKKEQQQQKKPISLKMGSFVAINFNVSQVCTSAFRT